MQAPPPGPTYQSQGNAFGVAPMGGAQMMAAPMLSPIGCPHCGAAAAPSPSPQTCGRCAKPFALYPGYAMDASIVPPPPDPRLDVVRVKWATAFVYKFAALQPYGVASGTNDPIIAAVAIEESGIMFPDVVALVFWRNTVWLQAVLATLTLLPITVGLVFAMFAAPIFAVFAAFFGALTFYAYYQSLVVKAHFVRVVGRYRTFDIRFDKPFWKRQRFHDELLRRAGHPAAQMP